MIPKDPVMLLSFINTKLRDQYENLDVLCDDLRCDKVEIIEKLEGIDYFYESKENQFK